MNPDMALAALVFLILLCCVLGIAGWLSDAWLERRRPPPIRRPPSDRCFRAGSVERYWREIGDEKRHRRRWMA